PTAHLLEAAGHDHGARVQTRHEALAPPGDRQPPEEGIRDPGRRVAARAAARDDAGSAGARAAEAAGDAGARRSLRFDSGSSRGAMRQPQADLDTVDAASLDGELGEGAST